MNVHDVNLKLSDIMNDLIKDSKDSKFEEYLSMINDRYINSKFLVIIPMGDDSPATKWNYDGVDLCIINYGSKNYKGLSKYYFEIKGPKWTLVKFAINNIPINNYNYIWIPDDDLKFLNETDRPLDLFMYAKYNSLDISQPALINNGNITPKYLDIIKYVQNGQRVRKTSFVEIMAPLLSKRAFNYLKPVLNDNEIKSGWGLDNLWSKIRNYKLGIINAVPMIHTRPVSKPDSNSSFYKMYSIDPYKESKYLYSKYFYLLKNGKNEKYDNGKNEKYDNGKNEKYDNGKNGKYDNEKNWRKNNDNNVHFKVASLM